MSGTEYAHLGSCNILAIFFQAASKSMLTRLLEINTLLLECTQMGSLLPFHHAERWSSRRHTRAPSVMNYIPQINKDWQPARAALLGLLTRPCPVFCFY